MATGQTGYRAPSCIDLKSREKNQSVLKRLHGSGRSVCFIVRWFIYWITNGIYGFHALAENECMHLARDRKWERTNGQSAENNSFCRRKKTSLCSIIASRRSCVFRIMLLGGCSAHESNFAKPMRRENAFSILPGAFFHYFNIMRSHAPDAHWPVADWDGCTRTHSPKCISPSAPLLLLAPAAEK